MDKKETFKQFWKLYPRKIAKLVAERSWKRLPKKDINAIEVVKVLGKYIGGSGGGQSFFATSGGKDPKGIKKALAEAEMISIKLK